MIYSQTCPRCGEHFSGDDQDSITDQVVEHARAEHRHALDRDVVLAHLESVHPHEREPSKPRSSPGGRSVDPDAAKGPPGAGNPF